MTRWYGWAFLALAIAFTGGTAGAQHVYDSDKSHTELFFSWSHVGVSRQHGEFTNVTAELTLVEDQLDASSVNVVIDIGSTHTGYEKFDDVLESQRFLHAAMVAGACRALRSISLHANALRQVCRA